MPRPLTATFLSVWISLTGVFSISAVAGPASGKISLFSPVDFQVFQRQTREAGIVVIEGSASLSAPGRDLALQFRFVGQGSTHETSTDWMPLPYDSRVPLFRLEVSEPAGGWYRLEVRATASGEPFASSVVEHVGVGEIFVIAGQSNSANHGETRNNPKNALVVAFDGSKWAPANDPQPGASGWGGCFIPSLGDTLAEKAKIPVGFISTGAGGTSVREWLPHGTRFSAPPTTGANTITVGTNSWASTGDLYRRLCDRTRALGSNGFRAVLWHQGESDNHQPEGREITPEQYQAHLHQLITTYRKDLGWQAPWFIAQASYHVPTDPGFAPLREAQKAVTQNGFAILGPNTDELGAEYREAGGQGVHFNSLGLERHGHLWAEKILPWLETVTR